jgi:hypothetical protein
MLRILAEPKWKEIYEIGSPGGRQNGMNFAKREDPGGSRRKPGKFTRYIRLKGQEPSQTRVSADSSGSAEILFSLLVL